MWIDRDISSLLVNSVATRPVTVLTGARQVGKTSLLQHLFPDYHQVALDLPSEAEQAELNPDSFLQRHPPPLIIDEVQYAPQLFRHLKRVVDQDRNRNGQFILTGSQRFQLISGVQESLAGRADIFELDTLSHNELSRHDSSMPLEELIWRGGYPEIYASTLNTQRYFQSYVATYLERDVKSLIDVSSLRDFERFVRACALRNAQVLSKADLARDIGISPTTSNSWLSVLQASNIISLLEPWHSNKLKSLIKSPKLYFRDTGLLCFLLNVDSSERLAESPLRGPIWESYVYGQIVRSLRLQAGERQLFFWRDRSREVDFLLDRGGTFLLLDAKWSEHPTRADAEGFTHVQKEMNLKEPSSNVLVSRTPNPYPLGEHTEVISINEVAKRVG